MTGAESITGQADRVAVWLERQLAKGAPCAPGVGAAVVREMYGDDPLARLQELADEVRAREASS